MSIFDLFDKISSGSDSNVKGKPNFIVAGLGNPGLEYAETRHNMGYQTISELAMQYDVKFDKMKFKSDVSDVMISGTHVLLMKPTTYMNNSGEAIEAARDYYKIDYENVLVIYDDIDLPPGKLRIRRKGSAGGHNGIKSIIALMGTEEFPRIKIGVGAKPSRDYDLAKWVLGKPSGDDVEKIKSAQLKAVSAIPLIIEGNIDKAMNMYSK